MNTKENNIRQGILESETTFYKTEIIKSSKTMVCGVYVTRLKIPRAMNIVQININCVLLLLQLLHYQQLPINNNYNHNQDYNIICTIAIWTARLNLGGIEIYRISKFSIDDKDSADTKLQKWKYFESRKFWRFNISKSIFSILFDIV